MLQADVKERFLTDFNDLFPPMQRSGPPERRADGELVFPVTFKNERVHFWVRAGVFGTPLELRRIVDAMSSPQSPADLRARVEDEKMIAVVVAPQMSEAAQLVCQDMGSACFDLAGNVLFETETFELQRSGRVLRKTRKKPVFRLTSNKAIRAMHLMLADPEHVWTTKDLAESADVVQSWVSVMLKPLAEQEWVRVERGNRGGVRVRAPGAILDTWRESYKPLVRERMRLNSLEDAGQIEETLAAYFDGRSLAYGLTGFSGAAHMTLTGGYSETTIYVEATYRQLERIGRDNDMARSDSGNVVIWRPQDPWLLGCGARQLGGVNVVNPVMIYLDLYQDKQRGRELAEMFREQFIGF